MKIIAALALFASLCVSCGAQVALFYASPVSAIDGRYWHECWTLVKATTSLDGLAFRAKIADLNRTLDTCGPAPQCKQSADFRFKLGAETISFCRKESDPSCPPSPVIYSLRGPDAKNFTPENPPDLKMRGAWRAGSYFIFDIPDGNGGFALAFWHSGLNRWNILSSENGYFLRIFDFLSAAAAAVPGGVVFKQDKTAIMFRPEKKEWALLSPAVGPSGKTSQGRVRILAREYVVDSFKKRFSAAEIFSNVSAPLRLELTQTGSAVPYYCYCAEMLLPPLPAGKQETFQQALAHEQFGCFLVPENAPHNMITLGYFPSQRSGDYGGECLGMHKGVVIIYAAGQMYGEGAVYHGYKVNLKRKTATELPAGKFAIPKSMIQPEPSAL